MRPSFELKVFGGAVLLGPDGPVQGRAAHRRRLALLAILAGAPGRTVGRERILGYLWPDQPSDAGRHQLSEALYVLRKAIGEGAFVTAGDEVGLNSAVVSTDVASFRAALAEERYRDAVQAYRGPFLDGFYVSDAPDFERWVEEERSSLGEAYASALEALAERCEREGDHAGAAGWWRRRAAHDPYSSRVALRLMNALAAAGERAGALKHAAAHAAFLREELGVDPDPEIGEAMQRLAAETAALPRLEPRFVAVEEQEQPDTASAGAGESSGEDLLVGASATEPAPVQATPAGPVRGTVVARSIGYVGAAMLGALLIIAGLRVLPPVPVSEGSSEALDIRRIAVLPFESPDDPELRMLANALTGAMIDRLSDVRSMRVVSRGGVLPYAGRVVILDSITERLRVGTLVTGRLQRSRDVYRVSVQLVDGNTGEQLASTQVQVREVELFALQDAAADEVERFLRQRLGDEVRLRERRASTRSAAAYSLVLRADRLRGEAGEVARRRDTLDLAAAAGLLRTADSLLMQAREEDRRWIQPRIDRAWIWIDLSALTSSRGRVEALDKALEHAAAALDIDPASPAALEARGTAQWRLANAVSGNRDSLIQGAERDLRSATMRAPGLARAWSTLSQVLRIKGALSESRQAARRALEEDAYLDDADSILHRLFHVSLMLRDYDDAARWCERGRRAFVEDWRFLECRLTLMREDPRIPAEPARAWELVAQLEEIDPPEKARQGGNPYSPTFRRMVAASISARSGEHARARAEVARARRETEGNPELAVDLKYDEAYVRFVLGERAEAIHLLREYLAARPNHRDFIVRDPLFSLLVEDL